MEPSSGWVHVFDNSSLEVVLTELSTLSDFVHYLSTKEAVFEAGQFMFAEAETDIMAYYLGTVDLFRRRRPGFD